MKSLSWNDHFIVGLDTVDEQHKYLLGLIDKFSDLLAENRVEFKDIESLVKELSEYTFYHFSEEEKIMENVGIDNRHIKRHKEKHRDFLEEVNSMASNVIEDNQTSTKHLLDFLTHWLVYHILGSDQNMGRQVKLINSGISAEEAYKKEERKNNSSTELLLTALNELFEQVSSRNKELLKLNLSLEKKVQKRTAELYEANLHLKKLSLTDSLTKVPNRRYAMQTLELVWSEDKKQNRPTALMMIDADHFKEVNDIYGHDAGDVVLKVLSETLQDSIRTDDTVCRLGGDEFLIICPNTNMEGALILANNIHQTISKMKVDVGNGGYWQGSISIGVSVRDTDSDVKDYEKLIKIADKGVYKAKSDGKNCVRTIMQ